MNEMNNVFINTVDLHEKLVFEFKEKSKDKIFEIVELICKGLSDGGCIYLCGNGGSAADAQHIAGELVVRFKKNRKALASVALTTDSSILTSIGNDYSFEELFSKQVEALVKKKDILWVLSTSGKSKNILAAANCAKQQGAKIIAFLGKPGGILEELSDVCLTVDCDFTASVQEVHELAYHIICELVENNFINK